MPPGHFLVDEPFGRQSVEGGLVLVVCHFVGCWCKDRSVVEVNLALFTVVVVG